MKFIIKLSKERKLKHTLILSIFYSSAQADSCFTHCQKKHLHQTPTSFFILGTMTRRADSTKWLSSSEFSTTAVTAFWHLFAMIIHTNFKTFYFRITENVANAIHYIHHIWRKTLDCLSKLSEYSSKQLFFINLSNHQVIGHAHSPKKNTETRYVSVITK